MKTDEDSDKQWSNTAVVLLVMITVALLIAFIWHYVTAKPPESELHTRPLGYQRHHPRHTV